MTRRVAPGSMSPESKGDLIAATLWMAIVTGLVEGAGSVALMKSGRLPGVWWDLLWASPLFDVVLFGGVVAGAALVAKPLGRPAAELVLPALGFLTASIWLGLALPYQVHVLALLVLSVGCGIQFARVVLRHAAAMFSFCRRTLPWVACLAAVVAATIVMGRPAREALAVGGLQAAETDAPNVVLVVIDALRADHLAANGYERATSPTLSRLAAEGASFESAFSTSPYTAPSHASLLTGLYPSAHGVQWIERRPLLSEEHPTIAEALAARGYRTAAFSANRFWFTREQGFGRGFHRFEDNYHSVPDALARTAYGRKIEEWLLRRMFEDYPWRLRGDAVTDAATSWAGRNSQRPYFLMLNYFDVHDPYFPPAPYRGRFSSLEAPGGILNSHQDRYHPEMSPAQLQEEIDAYDGAIAYVDQEIERLVRTLSAAGSQRDLLVVVTSDHGEAFGEHGAYIHANSLYREEIHVPLIIWSPGRVPAGFRTDRPVSNASVPRTILDITGGEGAMPGAESLSALWRDPARTGEHPLPVSEMEHWPWNLPTSPSHYGGIRSVVDPELHLIRNDSLGEEMYRWMADPLEARNVIGSDSLAAETTRLRSTLDATRDPRRE